LTPRSSRRSARPVIRAQSKWLPASRHTRPASVPLSPAVAGSFHGIKRPCWFGETSCAIAVRKRPHFYQLLPLRSRGLPLWCSGHSLAGYSGDGLLSLFYGSGHVDHQLLQIVFSRLKFRRRCCHFHIPIGRSPSTESSGRSIQGQSEKCHRPALRHSRLLASTSGKGNNLAPLPWGHGEWTSMARQLVQQSVSRAVGPREFVAGRKA
jgi:hypothetical protein